jgi:alpha-L-fucosidase 2
MQSHEGVIDLLPALPEFWSDGRFDGVCARGAFELDMQWKNGEITHVDILSKKGQTCRINPKTKVSITADGGKVRSKTHRDGSIEFKTRAGQTYTLVRQKSER